MIAAARTALFTPTVAEASKYADYAVEFREATGARATWEVENGVIYRWDGLFRRVPSEKKFIVRTLIGATAEERRRVEGWGRRLPSGWWAVHPDKWTRHRAGNGQIFFQQVAGYVAPDPCVQLELEMLIEETRTEDRTRWCAAGGGRVNRRLPTGGETAADAAPVLTAGRRNDDRHTAARGLVEPAPHGRPQ